MKIFIILFTCFFSFNLTAGNDYHFFSKNDIENIRTASQTAWGEKIIHSLKEQVEERRKHSLRIPLLEGGHLHHYFCPVHNVMFQFDWDKPDGHYCNLCGKYWENNKFFDWAWVNKVHTENLNYLIASMYLYLATNDTLYAGYIRDMMLDYASKYPTYMEHNTNRVVNGAWGGRMFGQSLDEAVWASDAIRAYSTAKPLMTPSEIKKIEDGYLKVCAQMLLNRKGGANWQVWHNSGLIALGVALENDSIIDVALNDPKCGYRFLMEKQVYNDGWWNEGSPIYHYYPLRAMLLSADALRCRNINLFDKKLYHMFASPAQGVYANLSFPAHNDGWYGESLPDQVKLYEIVYRRYNQDPFFLNVLKQCYQQKERNPVEALQNNIDLSSVSVNPEFLKSVCFEDAGFAVLRSKNKAVVLKYGPHGGGHGHPDKLSISLHDGKKEILPDMGTSAYGVPDYTQWYRKTLSHSTLTVDAKDQKETSGTLLHFKPSSGGGSVEAGCNDAYPGVNMSRKLTFKGNLLTDILTVSSENKHQYDYVLILTEKPAFSQAQDPGILDDAPVYKRISNVKKTEGNNAFSCQLENGTEIHIQVVADKNFIIFTGEAPGIPPRNPEINADYESKPCYPLIVRTTSRNLKIKTTWKIK
ncbi:MAG: heparinase II/III-family protein [Dysgonamonadaceae bacterium]|jgi:hypothetical protein|nr:heparinase II/III-family protein [Dysgonamonadaceae bacterium]